MRRITIASVFAALTLSFTAAPTLAQDDQLIPPRRMGMVQNIDLPGNDLRQLFGISIDSCLRNCLADSACAAVTYNAQASACFPKSAVGAAAQFQGAYSGRVLTAAPGAEELAQRRAAAAADFLRPEALKRARDQAEGLSDRLTGGLDAPMLSQLAARPGPPVIWKRRVKCRAPPLTWAIMPTTGTFTPITGWPKIRTAGRCRDPRSWR